MWTLHLPDVWSLVNGLEFLRLIDDLKQHVPELPAHGDWLRQAVNRVPLRRLIAHLRNGFAGHPDPAEFNRAIVLAKDRTMDISTIIPPLGSHFNQVALGNLVHHLIVAMNLAPDAKEPAPLAEVRGGRHTKKNPTGENMVERLSHDGNSLLYGYEIHSRHYRFALAVCSGSRQHND